jgi:hypothetical protein
MDDFLLMRKDEDFAYKVLLGDATDSIASFCSLLRARFYRFRIFRKLSLVGKSKWTSAGELSLVASKVKESKGEHAR